MLRIGEVKLHGVRKSENQVVHNSIYANPNSDLLVIILPFPIDTDSCQDYAYVSFRKRRTLNRKFRTCEVRPALCILQFITFLPKLITEVRPQTS